MITFIRADTNVARKLLKNTLKTVLRQKKKKNKNKQNKYISSSLHPLHCGYQFASSFFFFFFLCVYYKKSIKCNGKRKTEIPEK